MRFFISNTINNYRVRYESSKHAEWVITEVLSSFQLNYNVDTWKLPDFERVLLGIKDFIYQPTSWRSLGYFTLYLGREFHIFLVTLYMYFVSSRSLALSWQWLTWSESELLSQYYAIDLDDMEDGDYTVYEDRIAARFYSTFVFYLKNENTPILILDHILNKLVYTLYYYWILCIKFGKFQTIKVVDFLYAINTRFSYKFSILSLFLNSMQSYKDSIIPFLFSVAGFTYRGDDKYSLFFNLNKNLLSKCKNLLVNKIIKIKQLSVVKFATISKPVIFDSVGYYKPTATLLRKQRVYTKSKYARSRQYCKNIVLIGLLLNIVLMYGLNSNYYAVLLNAGYFIHPFYILMVIFSVYFFIKFKLYNVLK